MMQHLKTDAHNYKLKLFQLDYCDKSKSGYAIQNISCVDYKNGDENL